MLWYNFHMTYHTNLLFQNNLYTALHQKLLAQCRSMSNKVHVRIYVVLLYHYKLHKSMEYQVINVTKYYIRRQRRIISQKIEVTVIYSCLKGYKTMQSENLEESNEFKKSENEGQLSPLYIYTLPCEYILTQFVRSKSW